VFYKHALGWRGYIEHDGADGTFLVRIAGWKLGTGTGTWSWRQSEGSALAGRLASSITIYHLGRECLGFLLRISRVHTCTGDTKA
jgi:hypothetical protein